MRRRRLVGVLIGLFTANGGFGANPEMTPGHLRVARVTGTVIAVSRAGESQVSSGAELLPGTTIRTDAESSATLVLANGAVLDLSQNTEVGLAVLDIIPFSGRYEPAKAAVEPTVSRTELNFLRGEMVVVVKKLRVSKGSSFMVGLPDRTVRVGASGGRFRVVRRSPATGTPTIALVNIADGDVSVDPAPTP